MLCSLVGVVIFIARLRQGFDITFLQLGFILGLWSLRSPFGKAGVIIPVALTLIMLIWMLVSSIPQTIH